MKAVSMYVHGECTNTTQWDKIRASKVSPGIPPLGDNVFNCSCSNCKTVLKETAHWTELKKDSINPTNVSVGDRVIVQGKYLGVVRYIGDLDSSFTNDKFYVGVKLDDPVGEHDGIHKGKRFFKCPPQHGVLVPLQQVAVVPIPGKGHRKRLSDKIFSTPVISKRCCDKRLMKQAEKLLPVFVPKKSSIFVQNKELQLKHSKGQICLHHTSSSNHSLTDSANDTSSETITNKDSSTPTHAVISSPPELSATSINRPSTDSIKKDASVKTPTQPSHPFVAKLSQAFANMQSSNKSLLAYSCASMERVNPISSSIKSKRKLSSTSAVVKPNAITSAENEEHSNDITPLQSLTKVEKPTSAHENNSLKHDISKNDVDVSAWFDHVQSLKDSPNASKLYLSSQYMKEDDCHSEECKVEIEKKFQARVNSVRPKISFTSRLLSDIPKEDMMTPISPDIKLMDVEEFGYWMKQWGGGLKGWTMAQTLQKLKDAQRKGAKQIKWQQTIDELENDEHFFTHVKRIKALHAELAKIRNKRDVLEKDMRNSIFSKTPSTKNLLQYQMDIEGETKKCVELENFIKQNPMSTAVDIIRVMGQIL